MFLLSIFERITSKFALTYGRDLEQYINSHDPKSAADVERLTQRYQYKQNYQSLTF